MKQLIWGINLMSFLILGVSLVMADTRRFDFEKEQAIRHSETVLIGFFTGYHTVHMREIYNAMDDQGRRITNVMQVMAHEFEVIENLAGASLPVMIEINVRGAAPLPPAGEPVMVGIQKDAGSPNTGYVITYNQFIKTELQATPKDLKQWVQTVRTLHPFGQHLPVDTDTVQSMPRSHLAPRPESLNTTGAAIQMPFGDPAHPMETSR